MPLPRYQVAIIGGGPAGLMAAQQIAKAGHIVTIFERMPSVGRKLQMAGRGGLNLTHDEPPEIFLTHYGEAAPFLKNAIERFPPKSLRAWASTMGIETFVGTSHRVFPKDMKATPLLRAWLDYLKSCGVLFASRHKWTGWNPEGSLTFQTENCEHKIVQADAVLFALGGASWPRLGSDGSWIEIFENEGVKVSPLKPSNCGFVVSWSTLFKEKFAGTPVKPVVLSFQDRTIQGELMITSQGIEGSPVYALSSLLRKAIEKSGSTTLTVDLRPGLSISTLAERLAKPQGSQSLSNHLRKAGGLSAAAVGLLREDSLDDKLPTNPQKLAERIKNLTLQLDATTSIEKAISSAGGVALDEIDDNMMLRKKPGNFIAGEMMDWEAPTGGYLLQGAFSTAVVAAEGIVKWLENK